MNFQEFLTFSKSHKTIPVYKRIIADLLTPISAYMRLTKGSNYSFILESVEKGEQYGRYSFIGCNPQKVFKSEKNKSSIFQNENWDKTEDDFLELIRL